MILSSTEHISRDSSLFSCTNIYIYCQKTCQPISIIIVELHMYSICIWLLFLFMISSVCLCRVNSSVKVPTADQPGWAESTYCQWAAQYSNGPFHGPWAPSSTIQKQTSCIRAMISLCLWSVSLTHSFTTLLVDLWSPKRRPWCAYHWHAFVMEVLISSLYIVYGVVILHCFLCVVGGVVLSAYILYCFFWAVIYIVTLIYIIHLGEEFFFQWPF